MLKSSTWAWANRNVALQNFEGVSGEFVTATIEDYNYYDLIARVISKPESRKPKPQNKKRALSLPVVGVETRSKRG